MLVQADLAWQDRTANFSRIARLAGKDYGGADVVLLPEMFSTGFAMASPEFAETMDGPALHWMRQMAENSGAVVAGSVMMREGDAYFNRFLWTPPEGAVCSYDKRHLFRMAGEHLAYCPGRRPVTLRCNGWRLRPIICYDLRFPVWCRNSADAPYDAALVVANWPEARAAQWKALLVARAIENQCYVVGVNRVGTDGNRIDYAGGSLVVSPAGEILVEMGDGAACTAAVLTWNVLAGLRKSFPVSMDADRFVLLD